MNLVLCLMMAFQGPALRPKAMNRAIDALIDDPAFAGSFWGIAVYAPLRGEMLVERFADRNFRPASNMKVLTTLLAMDYLGPDYIFQTLVGSTEPLIDGVTEGDLVVTAGGDPSMSGNYSDGAYSTGQLMDLLIEDLKRRGLRRVHGDLVADLSLFDDRRVQYSWEWDDVGNYYATPIAPLTLNNGHVDVRLAVNEQGSFKYDLSPEAPPGFELNFDLTFEPGETDWDRKRFWGTDRLRLSGNMAPCYRRTLSISVWDTPHQFMSYFHDALGQAGIVVRGEIRMSAEPVEVVEPLAVYESEPLAVLAQTLMKESQNHYADSFLKTTAALVSGEGSFDAGSQLASAFVNQLAPGSGDQIHVRDGSGLSAQNNLTPDVLIALLRHGLNQPYREAWLKTFPVMGEDGTLSRRGASVPEVAGFVWAKTGYIFRSRALSGYVETEAGEPLIFSIMVNNYACPTSQVNRVQDQICGALRRLKPNRAVRLQKQKLYMLSGMKP